jgi:hypothetical protein
MVKVMGKMKLHNRTNTITGITGEHYVAAELSKRGYIATITPRNTHIVDILASSKDGSRTVSIQVKTSSSSLKRWQLGSKNESQHSPNFFYIFVNLNNDDRHPDFHIVESKVVSDIIKRDHEKWLAGKDRNGQPYKDSSIRVFTDENQEYLNNWEILGLDEQAA